MTLVTLSAAYGAGGSEVGPELARRLNVPFIDRAIPAAVAEHLEVPVEAALKRDESLAPFLERWVGRFAPAAGAMGGAPSPEPMPGPSERSYVEATEETIRRQAATGVGVILGRAAAVILREDARALHVRLDGPAERRVAQAMRLEEIDADEARRRLERTDHAREAYVKRFYGADARDCSLYHLTLDSTTIALDACVELILAAAASRGGRQ
jgi:cytidylate kinase